MFNSLSVLTAVLGALLSAFFSVQMESSIGFLVAFASGGLIYGAASELTPEIQEEKDSKKS